MGRLPPARKTHPGYKGLINSYVQKNGKRHGLGRPNCYGQRIRLITGGHDAIWPVTRNYPTSSDNTGGRDGWRRKSACRRADIGITWEGNETIETFLHGVKVVGPQFPRPVGQGLIMSTPYLWEDEEDRSNCPHHRHLY